MNENVTLIPARRRAGNRVSKEADKPKLKVAAYCRVSTDSDEQAGSYETQVEHYTDYISRNKEWELAGIYADEGISGTNTKKREGFNEMIDDCMDGKIDLVITKSISRFARNTLDCLKYVRQLRDKNIAIIFEKENINTLEASGELLLTIMASLAQQESQSLSQNVKLGLQFRYQNGQVQVNHNHFLGYTKDAEGNLVIDEEEAKIVRRIYREYLEGASLRDIADGLERDKIKTGGKKYRWHLSTIQGILKNEKYIGDALLQKTITTDFIEKTRIKNDGSYPQYYVTGNHEAIIPRDVFTQVQEEMLRRANMFSGKGKRRRVYSSKYALSSICTCTKCGDIYRRVAWNNRGVYSNVWRCSTRVENGPSACDARTIKEAELQAATVEAINQVLQCSDDTKEILMQNIEAALADDNAGELEALNEKLSVKQKELVRLAQAKKDYTALADEIDILNEKKQQFLVDKAEKEGLKKRIRELETFLKEANQELTEYDETMVRKYIREIKVYEDHLLVCFEAGLEVEIDR
ncbi:recombinase family protein [[Clostridium] polysaccharolyticum]|uniref:Site-specific DNA recombinase n=1 Tax=[Clostridium] polysaccharolyticum TaxID=29364 RepID=A0A1I0FUS8_9FIRM|nr:recombinase family protein [[Clostridium] polysaccharolyticum]SET62012.1 Site-specific DNA recombinase [[Clostridium] polysaccharolyticum]